MQLNRKDQHLLGKVKRRPPKLDLATLNNLMGPPIAGLERLRGKKGTPTDWYNVLINLALGKNLVDKHYTSEAQEAFKQGFDASVTSFEDNLKRCNVDIWEVSEVQFIDIDACLEANKELLLQCTRSEIFIAHSLAKVQMRPYKQRYDDWLRSERHRRAETAHQ